MARDCAARAPRRRGEASDGGRLGPLVGAARGTRIVHGAMVPPQSHARTATRGTHPNWGFRHVGARRSRGRPCRRSGDSRVVPRSGAAYPPVAALHTSHEGRRALDQQFTSLPVHWPCPGWVNFSNWQIAPRDCFAVAERELMLTGHPQGALVQSAENRHRMGGDGLSAGWGAAEQPSAGGRPKPSSPSRPGCQARPGRTMLLVSGWGGAASVTPVDIIPDHVPHEPEVRTEAAVDQGGGDPWPPGLWTTRGWAATRRRRAGQVVSAPKMHAITVDVRT